MEAGESVLVYPGGAHEIMKPSTCPNYSLTFWKERLGFVRYAIKNRYDIIPMACVGAEELIDVAFDVDASFIRKDLQIPIPSFPPRLSKMQKMYFWIGRRISTDIDEGRTSYLDDDICRTFRDRTRTALLDGIEFLQQRQAHDPDRFWTQRISNTVMSSMFPSFLGNSTRTNNSHKVPAVKHNDESMLESKSHAQLGCRSISVDETVSSEVSSQEGRSDTNNRVAEETGSISSSCRSESGQEPN
jgi:hypothetical protein